MRRHWRGHFLQFDVDPPSHYSPATGWRLLLIALVLEAVLGPRLHLATALRLPLPPDALRILALLAAALLAVRFFAHLPLSAIGLKPWRAWTPTEKSYFVQVFIIANLVFALLSFNRQRELFAAPIAALLTMATHFEWGFYQEVIYRGILQTELVRRWGAWLGILAANLLFTFGPLHFYHFRDATSPVGMFAAIFAIGLFFAALFHRSRNLWMVATFHGIGTAYILGA